MVKWSRILKNEPVTGSLYWSPGSPGNATSDDAADHALPAHHTRQRCSSAHFDPIRFLDCLDLRFSEGWVWSGSCLITQKWNILYVQEVFSCPLLYTNLLHKMGQDYLDRQYATLKLQLCKKISTFYIINKKTLKEKLWWL